MPPSSRQSRTLPQQTKACPRVAQLPPLQNSRELAPPSAAFASVSRQQPLGARQPRTVRPHPPCVRRRMQTAHAGTLLQASLISAVVQLRMLEQHQPRSQPQNAPHRRMQRQLSQRQLSQHQLPTLAVTLSMQQHLEGGTQARSSSGKRASWIWMLWTLWVPGYCWGALQNRKLPRRVEATGVHL